MVTANPLYPVRAKHSHSTPPLQGLLLFGLYADYEILRRGSQLRSTCCGIRMGGLEHGWRPTKTDGEGGAGEDGGEEEEEAVVVDTWKNFRHRWGCSRQERKPTAGERMQELAAKRTGG